MIYFLRGYEDETEIAETDERDEAYLGAGWRKVEYEAFIDAWRKADQRHIDAAHTWMSAQLKEQVIGEIR